MFSKIARLFKRDNTHNAKLLKITQLNANSSRKTSCIRKKISVCLANTLQSYSYITEIQDIKSYILSLLKRTCE